MDTLDAVEARVVGCLIEKALTTPDQYPMSLNALLAACNQKSNRDPVMEADEETVFDALQRLRDRGWATMVMPSSGRVERWRRQVRERLGVDGLQEAILAELLLRGPQTPGELRTRVARMKPIESLEALAHALDSLARPGEGGQQRTALVRRLAPAAGERAERWMCLLCPQPAGVTAAAVAATGARRAPDGVARPAEVDGQRCEKVDARLAEVERRLAGLEELLATLRRELGVREM